MSKHTEGDWVVDLCKDYVDGTDLPVLDSEGFPIAIVEANPILNRWPEKFPDMPHWADGVDDGRTMRHRTQEELEANARLIAAAPRLLDAIDELMGYAYDYGMPWEHPARAKVRAIRATLSAATGQEA